MVTTEEQLSAFISRQKQLISQERETDIERSSLLLSRCGPKLLEKKGLALCNLGVVGINIGLGGKTLVELDRPLAYHSSPNFPPHSLRPGDLARIEENVSATVPSKKTAKAKKDAGIPNLKGGVNASIAEGVVYKVSDTRIVIAVDQSETSSDDLDIPDRCRVVKLANSVTYDRMEKALDHLEQTVVSSKRPVGIDKSPQELTRLMQVLLGIASLSSPSKPISNMSFFDDSLNPSQKEAVKFALESPEVACIHGPPGTGKTHTLIEIIRQFTTVSEYNPKPLRLLVCGASNLSVDNILERLLALPAIDSAQKLRVTRIGHPARVMAQENILESTLEVKAGRSDQAALAKDVKNELDATFDALAGRGKANKGKKPRGAERKKMWDEVKALRKEYRQREGGIVRSVLSTSQVVLATCHTAGGRQLRDQKFDVLIIDEATQAMEAVCWIPIFKAQKLILAGDPMQLPPTILSLDKRGPKLPAVKAVTSPTSKPGSDAKDERKVLQKEDIPAESAKDSSDNDEDASESLSSRSSGASEPSDDDKDEKPTAQTNAKKNSKCKTGAVSHDKVVTLKPPRTLETTLFDRLQRTYGSRIKRMLTIQYRMHSQICQFPSAAMYSGKLKPHPSVASHLLCDLLGIQARTRTAGDEDDKELLETPVVFFDTAGCEYFERLEGDDDEGSRCNENEATIVRNWVEKLVDAGVATSQIAIITPYQAQVTLLSSLLRPGYGPDLEIGTVDGMQGREKDAVIISLVRSNEQREVGFLKDKRRLNVAMTRAKRHLCIIGDSSTVQHGGRFLKKWLAWLEANADVRYAGLE